MSDAPTLGFEREGLDDASADEVRKLMPGLRKDGYGKRDNYGCGQGQRAFLGNLGRLAPWPIGSYIVLQVIFDPLRRTSRDKHSTGWTGRGRRLLR
jgi:hypothetical protein